MLSPDAPAAVPARRLRSVRQNGLGVFALPPGPVVAVLDPGHAGADRRCSPGSSSGARGGCAEAMATSRRWRWWAWRPPAACCPWRCANRCWRPARMAVCTPGWRPIRAAAAVQPLVDLTCARSRLALRGCGGRRRCPAAGSGGGHRHVGWKMSSPGATAAARQRGSMPALLARARPTRSLAAGCRRAW